MTAGEGEVAVGAGLGLDSPLDRFLSDEERAGLLAATGAGAGDLVLVVADEYRLACTVLGQLRVELGGRPVERGPVPVPVGGGLPAVRRGGRGRPPGGRPPPLHHAPPRRPRPARVRPGLGARPRPTTWSSTAGSSARAASGSTGRTSRAGSSPCWGSSDEEAAVPVRVPARRLPLRRPAPRRLRGGHRPAGGHLRRRGQHPRGHRLPEDPVRLGPDDRRPQAAGAGRARATSASSPSRRRTDRSAWPVTTSSPARPPNGCRPGPRWRPGCGPAPSTTSSASSTWSAPGAPLRALIESDRLTSAILWGPPGTGKTTLATVVATATAKRFVPLSAVSAGVKDVREVVEGARQAARRAGPGDDPLPRRGPPVQPLPAGRPAALGGRGPAGPHRRHHREPLLPGQRPAAVAVDAVAPRAPVHRRADRGGGPGPGRGRGRRRPGRGGRPGRPGRRRRPGRADHPGGGPGPGRRPIR